MKISKQTPDKDSGDIRTKSILRFMVPVVLSILFAFALGIMLPVVEKQSTRSAIRRIGFLQGELDSLSMIVKNHSNTPSTQSIMNSIDTAISTFENKIEIVFGNLSSISEDFEATKWKRELVEIELEVKSHLNEIISGRLKNENQIEQLLISHYKDRVRTFVEYKTLYYREIIERKIEREKLKSENERLQNEITTLERSTKKRR